MKRYTIVRNFCLEFPFVSGVTDIKKKKQKRQTKDI